jgi:hypothetical protein
MPVSTDPDPNPERVYRTPQWDAQTMARAGAITSVAWAALICIPMFPADSWCSNFDAVRVSIRLDPELWHPVALTIPEPGRPLPQR